LIPIFYIYLIYVVVTLFYLIYWTLLFKQIRKNSLNIFELIFKFIIQLPFWLLFIYFNILNLIPQIPQYFSPPIRMQKLIIENNTRENQKYVVYLKDTLQNWVSAYPLSHPRFTSKISVPEKKFIELYYQADSIMPYDRIYIRWLKKDARLRDNISYAKGFKVPSKPIKLYSTDFSDLKLEKLSIDYSAEWNLVYLYLISILGIWYLAILPNDKFWRIFMYCFAGIFSLYSFFYLFNLLQSITEFYFLPLIG
jgi:hypothetical protein